jgi:AAA domain, putative AbiEii toxin, Type IV TA system/AAA ATPase domain
MAARLTQIRLRNFKSIGPEEQTVDLRPLTILIGRNNSGKSTVIQSLLLLKQTLMDPRPEVRLALQGTYVRATSLRELTHGWPEDMAEIGPEITLRWDTTLRWDMTPIGQEISRERSRGQRRLFEGSPLVKEGSGFEEVDKTFTTELSLQFREADSHVAAQSVQFKQVCSPLDSSPIIQINPRGLDLLHRMELTWTKTINYHAATDIYVPLHHFVPILPLKMLEPTMEPYRLVYSGLPRPDFSIFDSALQNKDPLQILMNMLESLTYVGASREESPPYHAKPTSVPTRNVLPNGGNAPELLYGRQAEQIHFASIDGADVNGAPFEFSDRLISRPLKDAFNAILHDLGIDVNLSFAEAQELGLFRLLFGRAPLNHVGRGISHVLPVIVAGLLADPLLGEQLPANLSLADYLARCDSAPLLALEEIESHLHPKAQTRLAHLMVALARSGRQLLVETHSDHLVRRLRGLVARTAPGSESERWLLENVAIVEVEQTPEGITYLRNAALTREGAIEKWPADFLDESADEERAIYFAAMEKSPPEAPPAEEEIFRNAAPPTSAE